MRGQEIQKPARQLVLNRRDFLRQAGQAVLAGSALPTLSWTRPAEAAAADEVIKVVDDSGALGRTAAPISVQVSLPRRFRAALRAGRLGLIESGQAEQRLIPVQPLGEPKEAAARLCWLMPPGPPGERSFRLTDGGRAHDLRLQARAVAGQYELAEQGRPVLRYNYATIEPGERLNSISADNRKYAVARSDYIHPLYGLAGEVLTLDWPVDHPHHRGIYWAWPEVDWQNKRGDLHALQSVFARPTDKRASFSGPVFCSVAAENVWRWEDRDPIVRERALIRAYGSGENGRVIDLELTFEAIDQPVQIARRHTDAYGGLNVRMSAIAGQQLRKYTAAPGSKPRPAWSEAWGTFSGATKASGLAVIQAAANPDYPGDWVDFPELNWLQPTFPASGTRFQLNKGRPLTLRYRLWIHMDGPASDAAGNAVWEAAHSPYSTLAGTATS